MPWLDNLLDEPGADTIVGRADALQDSLDSSEISAVFSARLATRLGRAWSAAEDLFVQLDRCATAISTRNRADALLTLVRGRDAGISFRNDIRLVLDTWLAWEETMPETTADPRRRRGPHRRARLARRLVRPRLSRRDRGALRRRHA